MATARLMTDQLFVVAEADEDSTFTVRYEG